MQFWLYNSQLWVYMQFWENKSELQENRIVGHKLATVRIKVRIVSSYHAILRKKKSELWDNVAITCFVNSVVETCFYTQVYWMMHKKDKYRKSINNKSAANRVPSDQWLKVFHLNPLHRFCEQSCNVSNDMNPSPFVWIWQHFNFKIFVWIWQPDRLFSNISMTEWPRPWSSIEMSSTRPFLLA